MKRFREVVQSIHAPEDKNVLWLDIHDTEKPVLRYYSNGVWDEIYESGGGGGSTGKKVYYGTTNRKFNIEKDSIHLFKYDTKSLIRDNYNKLYYYIFIPSDIIIDYIISDSGENILDLFNNIGSVLDNNISYTVCEMNLPVSLNTFINITLRYICDE